jgi:hypothetical protein
MFRIFYSIQAFGGALIVYVYSNMVPLTPKGLGLPYVGFSDSGQAAVNAFYF